MKCVAILIDNITKGAGTERAVVNLANILSERYSVTIWSFFSESGSASYVLNENVEICHCGVGAGAGKLKINRLIEQKVKHVISKTAQVIIGTDIKYNSIISRCRKVRTIGCEHFAYEAGSRFHKIISRFTYPKLDSLVLLTQKDAGSYSFSSNVSVIPNSLSFVPESFSDQNSRQILAVGRLSYQKGFDYLIKSACLMKGRLPDWKIVIYGDGQDKGMLESMIKDYGLEGFIEIRPFTDDIASVYAESSVYVMTSRWEGLPMVLIEAQSCGLPVVAFDCPCGPSDVIIDGDNGYLCPMEDIRTFADKVVQLAENRELREKMSERAKKLSERFSTESVAEKWFRLMESLGV